MNTVDVTEAKFSIFEAGINKPSGQQPSMQGTLQDVWTLMNSERMVKLTKELRALTDVKEQRRFKADCLPFVTFSGQFSYRNERSLIAHSALQCFDFDHLDSADELRRIRELLLNDPVFETDLLFVSPRGNGLKWVTHIDLARGEHKMWYQAIRHYLAKTYGIEADPAPSSVCSACFLCHDPDMVICEPLRPF